MSLIGLRKNSRKFFNISGRDFFFEIFFGLKLEWKGKLWIIWDVFGIVSDFLNFFGDFFIYAAIKYKTSRQWPAISIFFLASRFCICYGLSERYHCEPFTNWSVFERYLHIKNEIGYPKFLNSKVVLWRKAKSSKFHTIFW